MLSKLFGRDDPLRAQAKRLVPAASIAAISSFMPLLDRYPLLRNANVKDWDFFATAAATCVGIVRLIHTVHPDRFKSLYAAILPELHRWSPQGEDAVLDCQKFIKLGADANRSDGADKQFLTTDSLGMWVLWNLIQRQPSSDGGAQVAHAIGRCLVAHFHDWWASDSEQRA